MDTAKYMELHAQLDAQYARDRANYDWFRRFMLSLSAYMNRQHGPRGEHPTARFGAIQDGKFVADNLSIQGSSYKFAIEIQFFNVGGKRLFAHPVPFESVIVDNVLTIHCKPSDATLQLSFEECETDAGLAAIASLVDGPLVLAVELSIAKRQTLGFE